MCSFVCEDIEGWVWTLTIDFKIELGFKLTIRNTISFVYIIIY